MKYNYCPSSSEFYSLNQSRDCSVAIVISENIINIKDPNPVRPDVLEARRVHVHVMQASRVVFVIPRGKGFGESILINFNFVTASRGEQETHGGEGQEH